MPAAERPAFEADLKARRRFFGGEAYEASRTPEEKVSFTYALHETMDLWYAHQGTTVFMLTQLPEGATRAVGYVDSGWTTYERCSAEQIKKFYLFDATWKLVLDLGAVPGSGKEEFHRGWPIGPNDFDRLIGAKHFTNGSDCEAVQTLFRKMSTQQLGSIKVLDFDGMTPPDGGEAAALAHCLGLCACLEKLEMSTIKVPDASCKALFDNLATTNAMANLSTLMLDSNEIGDAGAASLADACATRGALARCQKLSLYSNQVGPDGMAAFAHALASGGLANLTVCAPARVCPPAHASSCSRRVTGRPCETPPPPACRSPADPPCPLASLAEALPLQESHR